MTLKQKTISGVLWTGVAKLVLQCYLVVVMVILARLLAVKDFGIIGMAPLLTVAISIVNDRGLGSAIVQKKNLDQNHLSSVFWGGIIFSTVLFALSLMLAAPLARFLHEPQLESVISVLAVGFIIGSFAIVQRGLLTREMDFKKLAIIEVFSVSVSGTAAVVMALMGFGVWSLVSNILLKYILDVICFWKFSKWRPLLHFRYREFKEYFTYSGSVMATDSVVYLNNVADISIIEKMLGSELFGFYSMAMNFVKIPITRLSAIVAKVVFPAFSQVQNDMLKFKNGYLKATGLISVITFPVLAGMALLAREFIIVFFTEKWLPMATPLILLTPMAILKSVGTIRGPVFKACGRPDILFKWNVAYFILLVAAVYWGTRYGLTGVAACYTGLYVITFPIIQKITNRQVNVKDREYYRVISTSFVASALMLGVGLVTKVILKHFFKSHVMVVLFSCFIVCILVYIGLVFLLDRNIVNEFIEIMIQRKYKKNQQGKSDAL
ncbi:MOP flippase family protein [candidate division KSB1 bacterium]|nr:MOP flippase family protein [candidate division KSB1 bacterium]